MRTKASIVGTLVLASSALAYAGEEKVKGAWEGLGAGSWVQTKSTTTMVIPGVEMPPQVQETRQTLVKVTDKEWVIRTEMKVGDEWTGANEFAWPRVAPKGEGPAVEAPKVEELGDEKVTVEGKEYDTKKVKTIVPIPGGTDRATTVSWVSQEHGTLKMTSESPGSVSSTMEVTSLAKKVKAGDKEIVCREMKVVSKMPGGETSMVTCTSDSMPGQNVRSEMTSSMSGAKTHVVSEVVAYEKK